MRFLTYVAQNHRLKFPRDFFEQLAICGVNTATFLLPPTLLDAVCIHVEDQFRKRFFLNRTRSPIRSEAVVQTMARNTITRLLSKREFPDALRALLPTLALP